MNLFSSGNLETLKTVPTEKGSCCLTFTRSTTQQISLQMLSWETVRKILLLKM